MNNQKILDNAPEGATSVNKHNQYLWFDGEESFVFNPEEKEWVLTFYEECALEGFRSLADIRRIAELEMHIQSLKVINEYIDGGCPNIQVVRSEIGEVISRAEGTYLKAPKEQGE